MKKLRIGFLVSLFLTVACLIAGVSTAFGKLPMKADAAVETWNSTELNISNDGETVNGFANEPGASSYIDLTIPEGVKHIAASAFRNKERLIRVSLPSTLESIGENAFDGCIHLVEILDKTSWNLSTMDYGNTSHGSVMEHALNVYTASTGESKLSTTNGYIVCEATLRKATGKHFIGYAGSDTALTVPAGVTDISNGALRNNTDVTSVVLPSSVKRIAREAFYGCTQLASCNIPETLESIGMSAFSGCELLSGTLEFPATLTEIGREAFNGCTSVPGLTFAEPATSLTIGVAAFNNCSSPNLRSITLPEHVSVDSRAFVGTVLQFVYLKADASGNNGVSFVGDKSSSSEAPFPGTATIVADNYGAYVKLYAEDTAIKYFRNKMTYLVPVTFNCESGSVVAQTKLAGYSYGFTQRVSGVWEEDSTALPTQTGYSRSVWYAKSGSNNYATVIAHTDISESLQNAITAGTEALTYYARYVDPASCTAQPAESKTYAAGTTYLVTEVTQLLSPELKVEFVGVEEDAHGEKRIGNAGIYTVNATLKNDPIDYGDWTDSITFDFTINKQDIDLSNVLLWEGQTAGGDSFRLLTNKLYVYVKNAGQPSEETKYSLTVLTGSAVSGYTLSSTVDVNNAIARSRGSEITVSLVGLEGYGSEVTVTYTNMSLNGTPVANGVRSATAANKYTLVAQVAASSNYALRYVALTQAGITVNIADDFFTAIVSKDWYLVDVGNALVTADGGNDPYAFAGWTYNNETVDPVAPKLKYSNSNAAYGDMLFTLIKDANTVDVRTFASIPYTAFNNYVNCSMPAGSYQLIVHVPQVTTGGITYFAYDETFNFEVAPAPFLQTWREDILSKLVDDEFQSAKDDNGNYLIQIYAIEGLHAVMLSAWTDFNASNPFNPTRTGIWREDRFNSLYSDRFYLTYKLDRMPTDVYYTYTSMKNDISLFKPNTPGTYTVYYQLEAKNYEPLTNVATDAKRNYKFTFTIYDLLELPDVDDLWYTGSPYYIPETQYYTVESVAGDDYTSAGDHKVTLVSLDGEHYRWEKNGTYLTSYALTYSLGRPENSTQSPLHFSGWQYGYYDNTVNVPSWGTTFYEDEPDFYTYVLVGADGTVYHEIEFITIPVGEYTLRATAKGYVQGDASTARYNWRAYTREIPLEIVQASNIWYVIPSITPWQFGAFTVDANLVFGTAKFNKITYSITTDSRGVKPIAGLEAFTVTNGRVSAEIAEVLNTLEAGDYYLVADVPETPNHRGLHPEPSRFSVYRATNTWKTQPAFSRWQQGKYSEVLNAITSNAAYGTANYRIVDANDENNVILDTEAGINKLATAKAGNYVLTATITGTDNYGDLTDFFTFRIFEPDAFPWWAILIIVVGVLGIAAIVIYILHSKGILQILTGRIVLAIRNKITVDATIAAVRAHKETEEVRKAEELRKARERMQKAREEAERIKAMAPEEKAEFLAGKAEEAETKAARAKRRADRAMKRVEKMKKQDSAEDAQEEPYEEFAEPAQDAAEAPVTDETPETAEAPAEETPVEEAPAEETPEAEAPAEETPAEETPVEEAPEAEEVSEEAMEESAPASDEAADDAQE